MYMYMYMYIYINIYIYKYIYPIDMWAGTVYTMATHCPHTAHTMPTTVPTWESSSIWSVDITQEY